MIWALDHLVVAAESLEAGVAWCEATLGLAPTAGGKHPLMSTHNRVFAIASDRFPRTYLEIIAIDPDAPPPGRARWFDLDVPAMQAALRLAPGLIHWAARCADLDAELAALRVRGIERGEALVAERPTPQGVLRWRIAVRPDGRRLAAGALPTLIEWGAVHPTDSMAPSGIALDGLVLRGLPDAVVERLPPGVRHATDAGPALQATLTTRRGTVVLDAIGTDP